MLGGCARPERVSTQPCGGRRGILMWCDCTLGDTGIWLEESGAQQPQLSRAKGFGVALLRDREQCEQFRAPAPGPPGWLDGAVRKAGAAVLEKTGAHLRDGQGLNQGTEEAEEGWTRESQTEPAEPGPVWVSLAGGQEGRTRMSPRSGLGDGVFQL